MEHFVSQIYIHVVYAVVSAVPIYLHLRLLAPWPILISGVQAANNIYLGGTTVKTKQVVSIN